MGISNMKIENKVCQKCGEITLTFWEICNDCYFKRKDRSLNINSETILPLK